MKSKYTRQGRPVSARGRQGGPAEVGQPRWASIRDLYLTGCVGSQSCVGSTDCVGSARPRLSVVTSPISDDLAYQ